MKFNKRDLSLRFKLIAIILVATFLVTTTGFIFIIINEMDTRKDNLSNDILTNTKIIGEICVSPLSFNDAIGAKDLLKKLLTLPEVIDCYIYDKKGKLFAKTGSSENYIERPDIELSGKYIDGVLNIIHQIKYKNLHYGWIFVRASTQKYNLQIKNYLIKMFFVYFSMLLLAYLLADKLQKIISKPILDLANVTNEVSVNQNFSIRVKNEGSDEIAVLYDSFNDMLSQIETRSIERDEAENELRLYKKMVSATNESMSFIDVNYKYLAVNDAFLKLFNKEREDVIGYHVRKIVGKDIFEKASKKRLDSCLNSGELISYNGWLEFPVLGNRYVNVKSSPYREANGDISGVVTVSSDKTERRLTEETLDRERVFTERALDSQIDTFFVFDIADSKAIRWNKRFRDVSGYSDEEIRKLKAPDAYYSKEDVKKASIAIEDTLKYGIGRTELSLICKNGERIPTEYFVSIIKNDKGEPQYFITVGRDISERIKAEKAIIESQRLGAIGEMASSVAHDFNNSLQAILGNLELVMLNKDISNGSIKYLNTIKIAAKDAASRIQLLQRFGGKRQAKSQYEPIDLNVLIGDVIIQSRPLWKDSAEKKGLSISVKHKLTDIPKIFGNEGELRSVIYNIIKNAIEAMPKGGKVTLTSGKSEKGVHLIITDNGIGMDEETKARIFQPFYSTKGFELGKGLGMSGAYSIIREHDGDIFIEMTSPGKGTIVKIILPYTDEKEIINDDNDIVHKGSLRLLWVDDEDMIRNLASGYIESLGHTGDIASNANEALELLEKKTYDLVITDLGMPGMSGWELADQIKIKYSGKIKVAIITGWGDQVGKEEKDLHNVDYVLGKPIELKEFQKLIWEVIKSQK